MRSCSSSSPQWKNHFTCDNVLVQIEDYEDFELFIKESFAMLYLKQYVEKEYSFMSFEAKYYNEDIVIYMVSDRELEVWLQDDYSFLYHFLYDIHVYNRIFLKYGNNIQLPFQGSRYKAH